MSDAGNTDDFHDEFLGALAALGGSAGNGRLRETLEWDEARYEDVKTDLLGHRAAPAAAGAARGRVPSRGVNP